MRPEYFDGISKRASIVVITAFTYPEAMACCSVTNRDRIATNTLILANERKYSGSIHGPRPHSISFRSSSFLRSEDTPRYLTSTPPMVPPGRERLVSGDEGDRNSADKLNSINKSTSIVSNKVQETN